MQWFVIYLLPITYTQKRLKWRIQNLINRGFISRASENIIWA